MSPAATSFSSAWQLAGRRQPQLESGSMVRGSQKGARQDRMSAESESKGGRQRTLGFKLATAPVIPKPGASVDAVKTHNTGRILCDSTSFKVPDSGEECTLA